MNEALPIVRPATLDDAAAIADIYNQGIASRLATLETEPRSAEERRAWLSDRGPRHPVIVATTEDRVVGWASINQFNARACYAGVGDISIYVAAEMRGRGIGRILLAELERRATAFGYHKLVLAMLARNVAAARLYGGASFREVGVYRDHGMLDSEWVDVTIMEKPVAPGGDLSAWRESRPVFP